MGEGLEGRGQLHHAWSAPLQELLFACTLPMVHPIMQGKQSSLCVLDALVQAGRSKACHPSVLVQRDAAHLLR